MNSKDSKNLKLNFHPYSGYYNTLEELTDHTLQESIYKEDPELRGRKEFDDPDWLRLGFLDNISQEYFDTISSHNIQRFKRAFELEDILNIDVQESMLDFHDYYLSIVNGTVIYALWNIGIFL